MTYHLRHVVQAVLPAEDDGRVVELGEVGEDTGFELRLRMNTYAPQQGARQLGEEDLDKVQPRPMLGGEGELEAVGHGGQVRLSLLGDMSRVVVQDDADLALLGIMRVDVLEPGHELPAAMPLLHAGEQLPREEVDAAEQGD